MSVTSLVRDKQFVARLREIYSAFQLRPVGSVRVQRTHELSSNIGTAFDYLYRIVLAKAAKLPTPHLRWDADFAARLMSPTDDYLAYKDEPYPGKIFHFSRFVAGLGVARHIWVHQVLANAKMEAAAFHDAGLVTDGLLWACYQLSFLDVVVRGGANKAMFIDPEKLSVPDISVIDELRQLVGLIDLGGLRIRSCLFLSPTLELEALVCGGVPDLFVDGWVCELKAVSTMSDATKWTDQLVVYAALAAMGGFAIVDSDFWTRSGSYVPRIIRSESAVKGIAIYFARHAEWVRIPLDEVFTREQLLQIGQLLCERLDVDEQGNKLRRELLSMMNNSLRVRPAKAKGVALNDLTGLQQTTLARLTRAVSIHWTKLSKSEALAMRALSTLGLAYFGEKGFWEA